MFGGTVRVIASMQPTHADTDKDGVIDAIGAERTKETYRCKSLKDAGAVLAFGSDWMVMPPRPVDCIAAAMNPPAPFASDEAISAADAIRALSIGPAVAARWEGHFGKIAPGYAADLTILLRDITHASAAPVQPEEPLIAYTVVDGIVRYEAPHPAPHAPASGTLAT
jgi:predicted amidohydrolase YtcJ